MTPSTMVPSFGPHKATTQPDDENPGVRPKRSPVHQKAQVEDKAPAQVLDGRLEGTQTFAHPISDLSRPESARLQRESRFRKTRTNIVRELVASRGGAVRRAVVFLVNEAEREAISLALRDRVLEPLQKGVLAGQQRLIRALEGQVEKMEEISRERERVGQILEEGLRRR